MKKSKSQGFTLIELLIVIAILGMLMVVVLVLINPAKVLDKSRTKTAATVAAKICTAVQVCQVNAADGICNAAGLTAATPANVPNGITSMVAADNLITVKTPQSTGIKNCTVTCVPNVGEIVFLADATSACTQ